MTVAERIRALREDGDKTQIQIAEILNVGQKTYSDYETQKIRIPLENVIKLAEYYDVDMNYICGLTKEPKSFPKNK